MNSTEKPCITTDRDESSVIINIAYAKCHIIIAY